MTAAAPALVQPLGKATQIGGFDVYVRRLQSAGAPMFRVTIELEHDERGEADFAVVGGRVILQYAQPAILRCFGGGEVGRARLQAALQAAYKPAPKVSPERAEFEAAREAWLARRCLANARRLNAAAEALRKARR